MKVQWICQIAFLANPATKLFAQKFWTITQTSPHRHPNKLSPGPTEYIFRWFTIEINSIIANNLKSIGMMKMQCVTIYPNIYECVFDYMKIHHDRFWTF